MINLHYLNHNFKERGGDYLNDYVCQKCNCIMYHDSNFGKSIYYLISKKYNGIEARLLINCDEYIIKNIIE